MPSVKEVILISAAHTQSFGAQSPKRERARMGRTVRLGAAALADANLLVVRGRADRSITLPLQKRTASCLKSAVDDLLLRFQMEQSWRRVTGSRVPIGAGGNLAIANRRWIAWRGAQERLQ